MAVGIAELIMIGLFGTRTRRFSDKGPLISVGSGCGADIHAFRNGADDADR